jgi:hypothetical protein
MGLRGPKPANELAIVHSIELAPPPDAPRHLTGEQADVWRQVVSAVPPGWFTPENYALLEAYTRHVISGRRVSMLVEQIEGPGNGDGLDLAEYDRLLKMQERESRTMASLATKMRISQQAVIDKRKTRENKGARPWEG